MMPTNPVLLMSIVNTLLRDQYDNPEALCDDKDWSYEDMNKLLTDAGYSYNSDLNQYR